MEKQKKLRAHHLLCIPLYQGEGYSQQFCKNMSSTIEILQSSDCGICVVMEPDQICAACPNLRKKDLTETQQAEVRQIEFKQMEIQQTGTSHTQQAICSLDRNEVESKDERLVKALALPIEKNWNWSELAVFLKNHVTEEIFNESCRNCRWRRAGLCSYEQYMKRLNEYL